jgi:hypothetical protein
MPREPKLDLAEMPQYVLRRGKDRQPFFFLDIDRGRYPDELRRYVAGRMRFPRPRADDATIVS